MSLSSSVSAIFLGLLLGTIPSSIESWWGIREFTGAINETLEGITLLLFIQIIPLGLLLSALTFLLYHYAGRKINPIALILVSFLIQVVVTYFIIV